MKQRVRALLAPLVMLVPSNDTRDHVFGLKLGQMYHLFNDKGT